MDDDRYISTDAYEAIIRSIQDAMPLLSRDQIIGDILGKANVWPISIAGDTQLAVAANVVALRTTG